jgi:hypothetical protein
VGRSVGYKFRYVTGPWKNMCGALFRLDINSLSISECYKLYNKYNRTSVSVHDLISELGIIFPISSMIGPLLL